MENIFGISIELILMSIAGLLLIFIILMIVMLNSLLKSKKRYLKLMGGIQAKDLEEAIINMQQLVQKLDENDRKQVTEIEKLIKKTAEMQGNVGLIRYNAFSDRGTDLSFSIAFLNDKRNGVVLTGIHNRENTFIYAKPIENGNSSYLLTPEEKSAIEQTVQKNRYSSDHVVE